MSSKVENNGSKEITIYESRKTRAKIDLKIKQVALVIIVLLNLAALGAVYYAISSYCPFPAQAVVTSSLLIGILGGVVSLGIPTFGVTPGTLHHYLNPVTVLGRALAYLFFAPTLLGFKAVDWTNYSDAAVANQVSGELRTLPFEKVASKYGSNIDNLKKYGFISQEETQVSSFKKLYEEFDTYDMERRHLKKYCKKIPVDQENPLVKKMSENKTQIEEITKKWEEIKTGLLVPVSCPELSIPDFSKRRVRLWHKLLAKVQPTETKTPSKSTLK